MDILRDFAFAFRSLRKNRGFATAAVIVLALGIGANTAIFSVVNGVLLQPLPYPEPERILNLTWVGDAGVGATRLTGRQTEFVLQNQDVFEAAGAMTAPISTGSSLATPETAAYVFPMQVTGDFFRVLGAQPVLGRAFTEDELKLGGTPAVVLSHGTWRASFGGTNDIIGKTVRIDDVPHTVVGVMPAGFRTYPDADIWTPLAFSRRDPNYEGSNYTVLARLAPDAMLEGVRERLRGLGLQYRQLNPLPADAPAQARSFTFGAISYHEEMVATVRKGLLVLFGAVAFVLLIACSNVAALLLARGTARTQEIAVRAALGATRARLARLLVAETLALSVIGGVLGLLLASFGVPLLMSRAPNILPRSAEIAVDARVAAFTLILVVLSAIIAGLLPALRASKSASPEYLRSSSRTGAARAQRKVLRGLIVVQSALALVLLAGAVLLFQSFLRLSGVNPGFEPEHASVVQLSLSGQRYQTSAGMAQFAEQVVGRIKTLPGVEAAGFGSGVPLVRALNWGAAKPSSEEGLNIEFRAASGDYLQALGVPLLRGRPFTAADNADAQPVVIINERLARAFWKDENPLGQHLMMSSRAYQVVGVMGNVHDLRLDAPPRGMVLVPVAQAPDTVANYNSRFFLMAIVVRGAPGMQLERAVRDAVAAVDPSVAVVSMRPLTEVVESATTSARFNTLLFVSFAAIGLLLTAVGIYGLISYEVTQRVREIGVRIAVGAQRHQVVRLFLRSALVLITIGAVAGAVGALLLSRFLASMLFELKPTHPPSLIAAIALITAVGLLAAYLPSRRASGTDPVIALRYE